MSKVEGKQHVQTTQDFGSSKIESNRAPNNEQAKSVYLENNDSAHDKFYAREGIERGRGNKHGLRGKKAGDKVDFIDGDRVLNGRVLEDNGDSYLVLVGDRVYTVAKETGKSRGHRKASKSEMEQGAQYDEYQQEQARIQEEQSARLDESIQDDREKHDVQLYNQKNERLIDDSKKTETKKKAVQSLSDQFQFQAPETEHQTLTVAQIILSKDKESELKEQS
jgi:hypothetical protein